MKKLLNTVDVVILTPIRIEYRAVRSYLSDIQTVEKDKIHYEVGSFKGNYHTYTIAIREIGATNTISAIATEKVLNHFKASIIILFGIAGGIKDVKIGDIVIGERSYDYETGKETIEGSMARPQVTNYDQQLIDFARQLDRQNTWRKNLPSQQSVSVFFGAIASGNKVIASTNSTVFKNIKSHLNDSLCLEMEAAGFGKVVEPERNVRAFLIRGISDLLDGKGATDKGGGQGLAVQNASAFLFGFLEELNFLDYKLIVMDVKEMLPKLMNHFVPLLKLEAVPQIGTNFKATTDTNVVKMWKSLKPLISEDIEVLSGDPDNEEMVQEATMAMRSKLRKALKENAELKLQVESLLKKAEKVASAGTTNIENSRNTVNASQISVGRDFKMGG